MGTTLDARRITMRAKNGRNFSDAPVSAIAIAEQHPHQGKVRRADRKSARTTLLLRSTSRNNKRSLRSHQAYLGENFAVKLFNNFKFQRLIENENEAGLLYCHFKSLRNFHDMILSNQGRRLLDCPNAGGSSVESEVLR